MGNRVFITCPHGLEDVTAKEIKNITRIQSVISVGGVSIVCSLQQIYELNYTLRTATHVLQEICNFKSRNIFDLYTKIKEYKWSEIIKKTDTISVKARARSKHFKNSNFLALRVKDAIVDRMMMDTKSRPSVSKDNPTYSFLIRVRDDDVKLYINTSGDPLYKRGYRGKVHRASLNPSISAGLVLLSSWNGSKAFYDPMCGSGTIPIEALMISASIPSGYIRNNYAFQNWRNYDQTAFKKIKEKYILGINKSSDVAIYASDNTEKNILLVDESLERLGMEKKISLKVCDILDFKVFSDEGTIIMNPPHGLRMSNEQALKSLYQNIGDVLKKKCQNHDAYIFCMNNTLSKSVGLRTKKRYQLRNGKLDCRLLFYPIRDGKYS